MLSKVPVIMAGIPLLLPIILLKQSTIPSLMVLWAHISKAGLRGLGAVVATS